MSAETVLSPDIVGAVELQAAQAIDLIVLLSSAPGSARTRMKSIEHVVNMYHDTLHAAVIGHHDESDYPGFSRQALAAPAKCRQRLPLPAALAPPAKCRQRQRPPAQVSRRLPSPPAAAERSWPACCLSPRAERLSCLFARLAACLLAGVAHVCGALVSARASLAVGHMCLGVFRVTLAATPSFEFKQHGPYIRCNLVSYKALCVARLDVSHGPHRSSLPNKNKYVISVSK